MLSANSKHGGERIAKVRKISAAEDCATPVLIDLVDEFEQSLFRDIDVKVVVCEGQILLAECPKDIHNIAVGELTDSTTEVLNTATKGNLKFWYRDRGMSPHYQVNKSVRSIMVKLPILL